MLIQRRRSWIVSSYGIAMSSPTESSNSDVVVDEQSELLHQGSDRGTAAETEQAGPSGPAKQLPSEVEQRVANFVIDALRTAVATEYSVHTCAGSIQTQFGHDPELLTLSLTTLVDFFLSVDNTTRKTVFYILNDLVQYDPRFRLPVLRVVLPAVAWTVSSLPDKDIYLKTVAVWEQRKVYPPEVCKTIEAVFHGAEAAKQNAMEYEQRISSLIDMIRIRSAKDEDLEKLFYDPSSKDAATTSNPLTLTAATIMAASTPELRSMAIMNRAVLSATQGTIEYVNRLLMDCESQYSSANLKAMEDILQILHRSNDPANQPQT